SPNLLSLFSLFSISKNPNCISFSSSFLLPLLYHICFLFERVFRGAQLQISLDTDQQTVTYIGLWSDYGDDGVRNAEPIEKTQAFSEEDLQILIGL
ncbi:MAG: hypothetical protein IKN72_06135, partial [Clostridia bacterium]|nr:hypothetical protein [Clostridia bacterium]